MAILSVGVGQQYSTLASAVAAASSGDTIQVRAGTYTNDFTTIAKSLTIEGVGGVAKFVATVAPTNGKAIMVTQGDVTIRNLEFTGAKVADANGAGVRYESGNLRVENSYFHHNQNGILSNSDSDGTITVRNSEFAFNGAGDGQSHNIYVNRIAALTIDDSYFHDVNVGHHIKSRASTTTVTDSRILDGSGTSSYNIDLPNGGKAVIERNVIQQSSTSPNHTILSYGAEGSVIAGSSVRLADNLIVDDHANSNATFFMNRTTVTAQVIGTDVWGLDSTRIASGPASVSSTVFLSTRPTLDTSSTWDDPVSGPVSSPLTSTITGTSYGEALLGTSGNDLMKALGGDDTLKGGGGTDTMYGGAGNDSFYIDGAGDVAVEYAGEGVDTIYASISHTLESYVENLRLSGTGALNGTGNSLINRMYGNDGANTLQGLGGDDFLYGRLGNDRLEGGDGADLLRGGLGTDALVGGMGADRFDWDSASEAGKGTSRDVVLDFVRGADKLDLSGIDAKGSATTNDAFSFIGSSAFSGSAGQLRFYDGGGFAIVQGDTNGDKVADFEIRVDNLTSLQSTDFLL